MILTLQRVVVPHGSYDLNNDGEATEMPLRACALAPDAAEAWGKIADDVVVSDMYRSADSSLAAVQAGRGAAAPGFSGHNYGLSIDIDVGKTLVRTGLASKTALDAYMNFAGWWCWREDHAMPAWKPRPNEAWHYNYSPTRPVYRQGNCVVWLGGEIQRRYGQWFKLKPFEIQVALKQARYYGGNLDGKLGPMSRAAMEAFARAWGLGAVTAPSPRFMQTLAYVTAAVDVRPIPRRDP